MCEFLSDVKCSRTRVGRCRFRANFFRRLLRPGGCLPLKKNIYFRGNQPPERNRQITDTCSLTKKVSKIAEKSKPAWIQLSNVYYKSSDSKISDFPQGSKFSILCTKDTSKSKISAQISCSVLTVQNK